MKWMNEKELEEYLAIANADYPCPCGGTAKCRSTMYGILQCPSCGRQATGDYRIDRYGDDTGLKKLQSMLDQWYTDEPRTYAEDRYYTLRGQTRRFRQAKPLAREEYLKVVEQIWSKDKTHEQSANEWDTLHQDQAMFLTNRPGFHFFSAYTPYGIQQIESWFIDRIREIGTDKQWVRVKELERLLMACPHLHIVIKSDLYNNLQNYKQGEKRYGRLRKRQFEPPAKPL